MYDPPQQSPHNSGTSPLKIVAIVAVVFFGLVFLVCGAGMVWLFTGPEGTVRLGNEMEDYAVEYIEDHGLVEDDERIRAYYDVTLRLNGTEAYILTDRRILHHRAESTDTEMDLAEIAYVDVSSDGIGSTIIVLVDHGSNDMRLEIAPFNGGDTFAAALERAREPYLQASEEYLDLEQTGYDDPGQSTDGSDLDEDEELPEEPVDL